MIYIDYTAAPQQVHVLLDVEAGGTGLLSLVLRSTVDLTETASLQFGSDFNGDFAIGTAAPVQRGVLYAVFTVTLPEGMPSGSYEYRVEQDGTVLATGVAQVGGYDNENDQYDKQISYEQYETDI